MNKADKKCCVPNCSKTRLDNVILHIFPNPEAEIERFRSWIYAIGGDILALENQKIYKYRRVCHNHFESRYHTSSKRLSANSVPTLHLPGSVRRHQDLSVECVVQLNQPTTSKGEDGILHKFPNPSKHPNRFLTWVNAVGGNLQCLDDMYVFKYRRICHTHFESRYWTRSKMLSNIAIPTLHLRDIDVTTDTSIKNYDHVLGSNMSITKSTEPTYADDEFDDLGFDDTHDENAKMGNGDVVLTACDDGEDIIPMYDIEAEKPVIPEDSGGDENDHFIPKDHQGFRCNVCLAKIVGFRYRCCECEDYDMCSNCESRQQHPQHYMLRIPGNREQTEIRRVLAAVQLSLALPPDLKEELTIKIEDPIQEQPPDPLDTGEADPTLLEPVNPEQMDTDSPTNLDASLNACSVICDPAPFTTKKPRVIPKNKNSILKIVGAEQSAIPVVLDALKRKAIVRLHTLELPIQEKAKNPAQTESLHDLKRRTEIIKQPNEQPTLQNTRGSSQNIPIKIYSHQKDPPFTHNIPPKSTSTTIYSRQIGENINGVHFPKNIKNRPIFLWQNQRKI